MFQNIIKKPDISFKDLLILGGLYMIGKGLYMIYPPAMWIGIGIVLFWFGFPTDRR